MKSNILQLKGIFSSKAMRSIEVSFELRRDETRLQAKKLFLVAHDAHRRGKLMLQEMIHQNPFLPLLLTVRFDCINFLRENRAN